MLQLEEHLLEDVAATDGGRLTGTLALGASTGPGAHLVPLLLCEFQREHPDLRVALSIWDTHAVIERVAGREVELGVVGALRRHRSLVFEPLARDEIVLAVPPDHPAAGGELTADDLRAETLVVMQEGAGVRQVVEEELRRAGLKLRSLEPKLELGLQESVKSAVAAGYGVTFISRTAIEGELAAGTLATARVAGLDPSRQLYVVRAKGRPPTRVGRGVPGVRQGARGVIVRWGLDAYPGSARRARDRAAAPRHDTPLGPARPPCRRAVRGLSPARPQRDRGRGGRRGGGRRRSRRPRRRQRDRHGQGRERRDRAAAGLHPDDLLRSRMDIGFRGPRRGSRAQARRRRRARGGNRLRAGADAGTSRGRVGRDGAERPRALCRGPLRRRPEPGRGPGGARRRRPHRRLAPARARRRQRPRCAARAARGGHARGRRACRRRAWASATRWRRRSAAATGSPHGALNAVVLPPALRFNEPVAGEEIARFGEAIGDAVDAPGKVEELARLAGFERLRDLGVPEPELPLVAEAAAERGGVKANPRPASPAEIAELLRGVW